MAGFIVNGHGSPVNSVVDIYYTYTWEAPILMELDGTKGPLVYKYAKSVSFDDVRLTWYDTVGLFAQLSRWRDSVWSETEGLRPAQEYKKNTVLMSYLPSGKRKQGWRLAGSWPSQIRYGELTYVNSDAKIVELTLTYDWAIDELEGDVQ